MGTSYELLKKDGLEIALDEHSNVFDLRLGVGAKIGYAATQESDSKNRIVTDLEITNLSTKECIDMAFTIFRAMSYWSTEEEKEAVRALLAKLRSEFS